MADERPNDITWLHAVPRDANLALLALSILLLAFLGTLPMWRALPGLLMVTIVGISVLVTTAIGVWAVRRWRAIRSGQVGLQKVFALPQAAVHTLVEQQLVARRLPFQHADGGFRVDALRIELRGHLLAQQLVTIVWLSGPGTSEPLQRALMAAIDAAAPALQPVAVTPPPGWQVVPVSFGTQVAHVALGVAVLMLFMLSQLFEQVRAGVYGWSALTAPLIVFGLMLLFTAWSTRHRLDDAPPQLQRVWLKIEHGQLSMALRQVLDRLALPHTWHDEQVYLDDVTIDIRRWRLRYLRAARPARIRITPLHATAVPRAVQLATALNDWIG